MVSVVRPQISVAWVATETCHAHVPHAGHTKLRLGDDLGPGRTQRIPSWLLQFTSMRECSHSRYIRSGVPYLRERCPSRRQISLPEAPFNWSWMRVRYNNAI
jgi:hypothetical protein